MTMKLIQSRFSGIPLRRQLHQTIRLTSLFPTHRHFPYILTNGFHPFTCNNEVLSPHKILKSFPQ